MLTGPSRVSWPIPASLCRSNNNFVGAHCKISGHYKSVAEFQQGTRPLSSTWAGPLHLVVQNIIVDGNQAAVELKAVDTTTKSGDPFPNEYTWVLGFNDNGKIATVRAYMDT